MRRAARRTRGRPRYPDVLTPAEWAVAALLQEGASNAAIASARCVSVNTVRAQVASVLAKLELPDRPAVRESEVLMARRPSDTVVLRCSFCGQADSRVEFLLSGPAGVYICGACVEVCNRIIERTRRAG